jgi:hypothetical protein
VVPPETDRLIGQLALAVAGPDGDLHHGGQILECAQRKITHTRCFDQMQAADWENDSGRVKAS